MKHGSFDRNVQLLCPTCAGLQFEHNDQDDSAIASVRCVGCGRVMTKDELLRENSENIHEHVKEIGDEVVQDVAKEMQERLKRALRGNKIVKFK